MRFSAIRALYGIGEASYGIPEAEIIIAEARLQIVIPGLLRAYYTELSAHEPLNQAHNKLLLPSELQFSRTATHLLFYAENQRGCMWGIALQDLSLFDPPVWISYDDASPHVAAPVWEPEADTLSSFLLGMAYQQALFAFPYTANAMDIGPEVAAYIRASWPVKPVALPTWSVTYFQATNQLLALLYNPSQHQHDLFVATTTEADFNELSTRLTVEWDYNSLTDFL